MYCTRDFKTKKALKDAVANGDLVEVFQPGGFFPSQTDGRVGIEGPHYPEAHTWWANAVIRDGIIVGKVR